jgi:alpha-L-rhamnosidase
MFPSIAFNFDISRLWAKIARDTVDSQLPSGLVPDIAPEYVVFSGGFRDSPEWGSAAILNPIWLWKTYGDIVTLNATYSTGVAYVNYLLSKRAPNGLLAYGLGDWIPVVASPAGVTGTATLFQDLQALAAAAAALGRPADAANFTSLAAEVGAAYERAFNAGGGSYPTQCAAGMALTLGITAPADVPAARARLLADVAARGNVSTSGEIGNRYALLAMGDAGAAGIAAVWASLLRNNSPGYGYMLVRGETALAESWDDSPGDSHIHAMYGHVDEFLYSKVAGVSSTSPAWASIALAPALLRGLDWLDVSYDSPRGLVRVAYNVTPGAAGVGVDVELRVSVPPGVAADVTHPLSRAVVSVVGGDHVLRASGADARA